MKKPRKTGKKSGKSGSPLRKKANKKARTKAKRSLKTPPRLGIGTKFIEGIGCRVFRPAVKTAGRVVLVATISCAQPTDVGKNEDPEQDSFPPGPLALENDGGETSVQDDGFPFSVKAHADDDPGTGLDDEFSPPENLAHISIRLAKNPEWTNLGVERFPSMPFTHPYFVFEDWDGDGGILTVYLPRGEVAHLRIYPLDEEENVLGDPYEVNVVPDVSMGSMFETRQFGGLIDFLHFYGGDETKLELGDNDLEILETAQLIYGQTKLVCNTSFETPEEGEFEVSWSGDVIGLYLLQGELPPILKTSPFTVTMQAGECIGIYPTADEPGAVTLSLAQM